MGKNYIPEEIRSIVTVRADFKCEYCFSLEQYSSSRFAIEHIVPLSKLGSNDISNLALACHGCNLHKYDKMFGLDEETGLLHPLYHPRIDEWKAHFKWNEDYTLLLGLTPTGRATIETLHLNRFRLINQRLVFKKVGLHPPNFTL